MGWFFSVCCFAVCFTPSVVVFRRLVAPDPLRIILFVLGAFFWLLSLFLSSIVFLGLGEHLLLGTVFISILFQEAARALYFVLMFKAQNGLAKLAAVDELGGGGRSDASVPPSATVSSSGARFVHSSRHILAIVCGLGMGTMSALFHLMNILAAHWDDGVVGLPAEANASLPSSTVALGFTDAYFPLYYSLACALLTLFNLVWTVCVWDSFHRWFHKIGNKSIWMGSIAMALCSHFANSTASLWLSTSPFVVLPLQAVLLACCTSYCIVLIRKCNGSSGSRNLME